MCQDSHYFCIVKFSLANHRAITPVKETAWLSSVLESLFLFCSGFIFHSNSFISIIIIFFLSPSENTLGGVMEIPSSGSIVVESPGYPRSYPNNSFTKWTITAGSPNVRLRGAVQDLQTDSIGDYLEIFDGNVTEVTRRRRRRRRQSQLLLLSGEVTEQQTFESSGRIITVLFVSDSEGMGRGFSLTVEGVPEVTGG